MGKERVGQIDSGKETYTTTCETDSQWGFAARCRELNPGNCDPLETWDGEGGGRGVQERGDTCIPMAASC